MNIIDKIFTIMNEYDELLENKSNNINIPDNNDNKNNKNNKSFKEKDNIINEMDDFFFKYIYKNINININQKNENKKFLNKMNYENNENTCYIQNNNTCDIPSNNSYNNKNNTNDNYDINDTNNINDKIDDDINKDNIEDEIDDINIYMKKIYKKVVLRCHPDKNGDEKLFIKCQEYYENKFLIGLLYINYKLKLELPTLNQKIINQILFEIRVIQEKIIYLKLELKKNVNK